MSQREFGEIKQSSFAGFSNLPMKFQKMILEDRKQQEAKIHHQEKKERKVKKIQKIQKDIDDILEKIKGVKKFKKEAKSKEEKKILDDTIKDLKKEAQKKMKMKKRYL